MKAKTHGSILYIEKSALDEKGLIQWEKLRVNLADPSQKRFFLSLAAQVQASNDITPLEEEDFEY